MPVVASVPLEFVCSLTDERSIALTTQFTLWKPKPSKNLLGSKIVNIAVRGTFSGTKFCGQRHHCAYIGVIKRSHPILSPFS